MKKKLKWTREKYNLQDLRKELRKDKAYRLYEDAIETFRREQNQAVGKLLHAYEKVLKAKKRKKPL